MRGFLCWCFCLLLLLPPAAVAQVPVLTVSEDVARAGYYRLDWSGAVAGAGARFVLQRAADATFAEAQTVYRGLDSARVQSGVPDGTYYYRVRVEGPEGAGPWSAPRRVEVAHHPLPRALGFLGVGLLVFLMTLGLIVSGARAAAKEPA
ncbi:fibronectin type III domain-containing protein [Ectothiorhodospiraceae bacterium 2226]|nr:fibronectin type III domain-containing protein [Ectothiorhodospiraceae bacterium 2226]